MPNLQRPGAYAWGDNSGRVVAPYARERIIKAPQRLPFFENALLRDLQISKDAGVAVNEKGDILQWGNGYNSDAMVPEVTLKDKNIDRVVLSEDKVIAFSRDKTIYAFPISKKYQKEGAKPKESSWIPGLSSRSSVAYHILKPELGFLESISDISAGKDHLLILTSNGRLFSCAVSFHYPARGQLGIPGLSWDTRPTDKPYDTVHEITALNSYKIKRIATGDYHSVALDRDGRLFTFGDNVSGQLGFGYNPETDIVDKPRELLVKNHYTERISSRVTDIAAGGTNTFFVVDVQDPDKKHATVDILACGTGIHGSLGNGKWTHVQGVPTKVKALSGLLEFDERANRISPIRAKTITVGSTHVAATMSNATSTSASDFNYGHDALFWGSNETYQIGSRKRNNESTPVHIPPLDATAATGASKGDRLAGDLTTVERGDQDKSAIIRGAGSERVAEFTRKDLVHRFQVAPQGKTKDGRKAEQVVVLGNGNSAVYMKAV